ncbi:MAG: T9SS type A sorting domain-containing protein [Bacteroidia bacterium]|nr:T9SS type A sorting domain-containing protein [Bacteroidia bacterium]
MKKLAVIFLLSWGTSAFAQTRDWRFGFEYDETEPNFLLGLFETHHDTLLSRIAQVSAAQSVRGGINVNGISWDLMQDSDTAAIAFSKTDEWVKRFQKYGFEFVFYFVANAPWSYPDNPDCIDAISLIPEECAPDSNHWQHWYDYVYAVVERYDGDGTEDMPGLVIPLQFYVMEQEVYVNGTGNGDPSEQNGQGFWEDNMHNLIRLHEVTYQAMKAADPSGHAKLVGSGGLWFDLYSDFPDYPDIHGSIVHARLNGNNLGGSIYTESWDSLSYLISKLGNDGGGGKCDYIGWHPHLGWKATEQSLRFVKTFAPGKPLFVDDMWSAMFTTTTPQDGFTQFIGGDSIEGDFPNQLIPDYPALITGTNNGDSAVINWYNAKTAREAVKCFATTFGEGAERVCYSMTNDPNPQNPAYNLFTGPWRWTGMTGHKNTNYRMKPAAWTMKMLIEKLHDFTSVSRIAVSNNPYTRVYKFERERGTACYVAWSEAGWNTQTPEIPNGETVSFNVFSDTLILTQIISLPGETTAESETITTTGNNLSIQLGFSPVIVEETDIGTGVEDEIFPAIGRIKVYPNPSSQRLNVEVYLPESGNYRVFFRDISGKIAGNAKKMYLNQGWNDFSLTTSELPSGVYILELEGQNEKIAHRVFVYPGG